MSSSGWRWHRSQQSFRIKRVSFASTHTGRCCTQSSHWAALICSLKPQYCINSGSSSDNSPFHIPLIMLQRTLKQKCNQLSRLCFLYPEHVVYSDTDMLKSSPGALSFYSAFSSKLIWNSWQRAVFRTHQLVLPVWTAEVLTVINCWVFCLSCSFC